MWKSKFPKENIYFETNNGILYCGDCLEVMKGFPKGVFDAVIADPPYGTTVCKWDSIIPFDDMWRELKKIRKDRTPIVLFGSEPFSSLLRISNIKEFRYDWVWYKNLSGGFALARKRPFIRHEIISVFYKRFGTYNPQFREYYESVKKRFRNGEKVNRRKQLEKSTNTLQGGLSFEGKTPINYNRGAYPISILEFKAVCTANNNRLHPTQKPLALVEYLVRTYSNESDLVLDFTCGSGTTLVACERLSRKWIGIEINEEYCKIAKERILKESSRLPL